MHVLFSLFDTLGYMHRFDIISVIIIRCYYMLLQSFA